MYHVYGQCGRPIAEAKACDITVSAGVPFTCSPSQGSINAPIGLPATDSEACLSSEWNPRSSELCSWQVSGRHFPYRGVPWGLVFFGISLSVNYNSPEVAAFDPPAGFNGGSVTHQAEWDLNRLQDRRFQYVSKTDDQGWLCGGGESTTSTFTSFRIPAPDSAHIEIAHLGNARSSFNKDGAPEVREAFEADIAAQGGSGFIAGMDLLGLVSTAKGITLSTSLKICPTYAEYTSSAELQLRFNVESDLNHSLGELYVNTMRAFREILVLERGDPFHCSIARELVFATPNAAPAYLRDVNCTTVDSWRRLGERTPNGRVEKYRSHTTPGLVEDISGGFFLFITRQRPLIYFLPSPTGCRTFYIAWSQNNEFVLLPRADGTPITEYITEFIDPTQMFTLTGSQPLKDLQQIQWYEKPLPSQMPCSEDEDRSNLA